MSELAHTLPQPPALAPRSVVIGVFPSADTARVDATLCALHENTGRQQDHAGAAGPAYSWEVVLLAADADVAAMRLRYRGIRCLGGANNGAQAFNRMTGQLQADVYVMLESGALVAHGWLDALLAALAADASHGLAGPSTNHADNEQAAVAHCRPQAEAIEEAAAGLARRHGGELRVMAPPHGLAGFCYAVTRQVVERIGGADDRAHADAPHWEADYNQRAWHAGVRGVRACAAFVWRHADDDVQRALAAGREAQRQNGAYPLATAAPTARPPALPLVSCIMPTRGRPAFVARAILYFQRQDYPQRELIIAYEHEDDIAPRCTDVTVRYVQVAPSSSMGARRNEALRNARGTLVAHWDDDDWHADTRLSRQLQPILSNFADITGLNDIMFLQLRLQQCWRIQRALFRKLFVENVCGGTLVYRRSVWERSGPYPTAAPVGADAAGSPRDDAEFLLQALRGGARLCRLAGGDLFMYVRHDANSWKFQEGRYLQAAEREPAEAPALPQGDREFYAALAMRLAPPLAALPLVSCIMPTAGRLAFVPQAIAHFLRQDYPHKELIILDDGAEPAASLVPPHPAIRYIHMEHKASIGAKRNLACEMAGGDIIVHWDDDDWMAAGWLASQVETLRRTRADICGLNKVFYYAPESRQAWQYVYAGERPWVSGGTLCYTKAFWQDNRFPDISDGEDRAFLWSTRPKRIALNETHAAYVATVHRHNAGARDLRDGGWHPYSAAEIEQLLSV